MKIKKILKSIAGWFFLKEKSCSEGESTKSDEAKFVKEAEKPTNVVTMSFEKKEPKKRQPKKNSKTQVEPPKDVSPKRKKP